MAPRPRHSKSSTEAYTSVPTVPDNLTSHSFPLLINYATLPLICEPNTRPGLDSLFAGGHGRASRFRSFGTNEKIVQQTKSEVPPVYALESCLNQVVTDTGTSFARTCDAPALKSVFDASGGLVPINIQLKSSGSSGWELVRETVYSLDFGGMM